MPVYTEKEIEVSFQCLDLHQAVNCIIFGHSTNRQDIRDFALQVVDFTHIGNILDLGCGFGFSTLGFKDKIKPNTHIVGLDIQDAYQKPFLRACESIGAIGEFHASDVAELATYPPHSFDLVFSCFSLYFFPEAVKDIARVLTDHGIFIAVTHSQETLKELIQHIPSTMEALGLGVPELLSIQKLLWTFSAENGETLLKQHFRSIEERTFSNSLVFRCKEIPHIEVYLQMKKRLLFKEVYDASPDVVGAALNQIMAALTAEAKEKGTVEFNKNDAVFLCREPLVAREERARPTSPQHCIACGSPLTEKKIEGKKRAICTACGHVAYENPLPVAAALVVNDRNEVLLVRRARHPMKGMWCLPCGFAEKDEQIEEAVLRELQEETRLTGSVTRLLDAVTAQNFFYGNLVMITFEIGHLEGNPRAGDDADEVRYFPLNQIPPLAFPCQERSVLKYREVHGQS
ncbi:MAG: NUDIX domain-containing protein [Deltaproteobacteria bacterium]|nr:NUDIX domain-containing protein [Deltaproteobacteria bacterium]